MKLSIGLLIGITVISAFSGLLYFESLRNKNSDLLKELEASKDSYKMRELGVEMQLTPELNKQILTGLYRRVEGENTITEDQFYLSTVSIINDEVLCGPAGQEAAVGVMSRGDIKDAPSGGEGDEGVFLVKKFDDFYIALSHSPPTCTDDPALLSKINDAFMALRESFKTIKAI